jgi:hypothetical protein
MKKENKKNNKEIENLEEEKLFPDLKFNFKLNKNIVTILIILAVIIALIIAGFIYKEKSSKFNYKGIPIEKNYFGSILMYTSKFSFSDSSGNVLKSMEIDFRNDPRTIDSIPLEIKRLGLIKANKTYVTDNNIQPGCEDAGIAFINLARFLSNVGLDIKGAVGNETKALETNVTFADCATYPENTVIMISNGEETKIEQTTKNCYEITFKNCEILKATERFELFILEKILEDLPKK